MPLIKDFFKYGGSEFRRRQVFGCMGGLIGAPVICCLFMAIIYFVDQSSINPWLFAIPVALLFLAVPIFLLVYILYRRK